MKNNFKDTRYTVTVALMMAIIIVLANTPLGMIQLPIIKATTVHIPVIIGAIVLGPLAGAILGATFGVCSLISNTMALTADAIAKHYGVDIKGKPIKKLPREFLEKILYGTGDEEIEFEEKADEE